MLAIPQTAYPFADFGGPVRLLVVDDDPTMAEFARMHCAGPHVSVDSAGDGFAGLNRLTAEPWDLVLLDLHMPRMDGLSVLMEARRMPALHRLPILMVTSRSDVFAIERAYELGATAFTTKPVNWPLLVHQMRYVLRSARLEAAALAAKACPRCGAASAESC